MDPSDEICIKELAELVKNALEYKGEIIFDLKGQDGQMKKTASNAKLRKYLSDFTFTPLKDGIMHFCLY